MISFNVPPFIGNEDIITLSPQIINNTWKDWNFDIEISLDKAKVTSWKNSQNISLKKEKKGSVIACISLMLNVVMGLVNAGTYASHF